MNSSPDSVLFRAFSLGMQSIRIIARSSVDLGSTARKEHMRTHEWAPCYYLVQYVLLSKAFFAKNFRLIRVTAFLAGAFWKLRWCAQSRGAHWGTTTLGLIEWHVLFLNGIELKYQAWSSLYRHLSSMPAESEKQQIQTWSTLALAASSSVYR